MMMTRQQYVAGTHYTSGRRETTKWSKIPCLRNQRDGRGLKPGPPDPEFEARRFRLCSRHGRIFYRFKILVFRGSVHTENLDA